MTQFIEVTGEQMLFKRAVVTVLEKGLNLSRICDEDDHEFTVKTSDLLPYHPIIGTGTYEEFATILQRRGYTLTAEIHEADELEPTQAEYITWTNGETLPDELVKLYPNRPGTVFWREWCLHYQWSSDFTAPFELVREGTGGGGHGLNRKQVGIIHKNGKVTVRYSSIIEKLIRAGLRAQKG